jgi:hypothetical protein
LLEGASDFRASPAARRWQDVLASQREWDYMFLRQRTVCGAAVNATVDWRKTDDWHDKAI